MTNKEFEQKVAFTPRQIDAAYINSIVDLINACRKYNVKVNVVRAFQNGWQVTFNDFKGDAICHDHSYGSPCYLGMIDESAHANDWSDTGRWETMGFPWDGDDVSVHDSEWLAHAISRLSDGHEYDESWEEE